MVLSDKSIKEQLELGRVVVSPLDPQDIQPASIDLHLDRQILIFSNSRHPYIDVRESLENLTEIVAIPEDSPFILHPGEFVLGSTVDVVEHTAWQTAARDPAQVFDAGGAGKPPRSRVELEAPKSQDRAEGVEHRAKGNFWAREYPSRVGEDVAVGCYFSGSAEGASPLPGADHPRTAGRTT